MLPQRLLVSMVSLLLAVGGWLSGASRSQAAEPEQRKQAKELVMSESLPADQVALFDKVIADELQQLTKPSEANLPRLPKGRAVFVQTYLPARKNGDPRARVLALTLAKAKQVLEGDYPLPVKANFVLLLGELDEESPTNPPPKPSKQAFEMLLALVQPKAVTNESDVLMVEALVGLQRLASIYRQPGATPPEGAAARLSRAMLAILTESTPPEGRSADGHDWMRRSAGQTLALLGNPGENGEIAQALLDTIRDHKAPLFLRCGLAQFVGELKYSDNVEPTPAVMAKVLVELAHDACRIELTKARRSGRNPSERAFRQWLEAVQDGIVGAKGAPTLRGLGRALAAVPDSKEAVQAAKKDIDKLLEMVNNREFVALAQTVSRVVDTTDTTARRE